MPKIFNIIFEVNLTIGGSRTSTCPCVTSFKQFHANVAFAHAQTIAFYLFCCKIDLGIIQDVDIHDQMILMSKALFMS
jgi:hypothetical protein